MTYSTKSNAKRAALKQCGRNAQEGHDYEIVGSGASWDWIPGTKFDVPEKGKHRG